MFRKSILFFFGFLLVVFLLAASPSSGDDFATAKKLAEQFMESVKNIRSLNKEEEKRLVQAICDADEEERKSVAQDAASRVSDDLRDPERNLEELRVNALKSLDSVISDEAQKDRRSDAEDLKRRLLEAWESVDKMLSRVRGSNNPVSAYMVDAGQKAHKDYQSDSSKCHLAEWTISNGRADCLNDSNCEVIELKPKNTRSINKGRGQSEAYAEVLNLSEDEYNKLIDEHSEFKKCKGKFKPKLRCYELCPEIDEDGNYKSVDAYWSDC